MEKATGSLDGKLCVITGAAGGLGTQLALALARRRARLALWDIAPLDDTLRALGHLAEHAVSHAAAVDVADDNAVRRAAETLTRRHGTVYLLINAAAVVGGCSVLSADGTSLRRAFEVNALSHFWTVRAFLPAMLADGAGCIVTVSSLMAGLPAARLADYCAAKAAVAQLHECLRWELRARRAPHGVRCLLVQTYLLDTPLFAGGRPADGLLLGWLFPTLKAEVVAERVVDAVLRRRERLVLPSMGRCLAPLLQLLPLALRDVALEFAGARTAMDTFRGRGRLHASVSAEQELSRRRISNS